MTPLRMLATLGGVSLIVLAFGWAMQVLTVKGAEPPPMARLVFRAVRSVMFALGNLPLFGKRRQQIWALYVSVSLLTIVALAIAQILAGYTLVFYGVSADSLRTSYINSISSLSVLGFGGLPSTLTQSTLALAEAFTGPIFVALLISYLANMNSSVSQRQSQLRTIETRIGAVASGPELLERAVKGSGLATATIVWQDWTREFVQARAALTTVEGYLLAYSPGMHVRWVADAQTVLDAANLRNTAFDLPADPEATRCLAEGADTLQGMATHLDHPMLRLRRPRHTTTVTREQFDRACDDLARANAPVTADHDAAWAKFQQERTTYEGTVRQLSQFMDVPVSEWP
ncbi:MAG: hypothetical protein QM692_20370 [Thermomicrobiales bacterium]